MDKTSSVVEYAVGMAIKDVETDFPFRRLFRSSSSIEDICVLRTYSHEDARSVSETCARFLMSPKQGKGAEAPRGEEVYKEFVERGAALPNSIPDLRLLRSVAREGGGGGHGVWP